MRGTSPVGGSVQCGRSGGGGAGVDGADEDEPLVTREVGSASSGSGNRTAGRGPAG